MIIVGQVSKTKVAQGSHSVPFGVRGGLLVHSICARGAPLHAPKRAGEEHLQ
jgi:hypothetical protein